MSNSDNTSGPENRPLRPIRSRFNFSNNRLSQPPAPVAPPPSPVRNLERETRRNLRKQLKASQPVLDKNGPLVFNVAQLLRSTEGSTRSYGVEADELELENERERTATNVKGNVTFTRVRHDVLAQGKFEADTIVECVRCLNDFETHVDFELEDIFRPSIDVVTGLPVQPEDGEDADDMLLIDENHLLDLGEALRQQILVSLPMYPVCREDCPGLYQYLDQINADFVEEEVEEEEPEVEQVDKRWSALKNLHLDE